MNAAFISYTRADIGVAVDIQKRLEKYPYPHELVTEENRPEDPVFVRKIFLDVTDLPVSTSDFSEHIRTNLEESRYLIVICSKEATQSDYVKREIDYFLSTHNNDADLIVAVYVDKILSGMHPVIDHIVATRNCPIYVSGKGAAGEAGRKYCFYHILEFLLKVDFDKLYNRYVHYKRRKRRRRAFAVNAALSIVFCALAWGWYSQKERTKIEHARVEFEMGIFPYSLVVGYVDNFLLPVLNTIHEQDSTKIMIISMPNTYDELNDSIRFQIYKNYLATHYLTADSVSVLHIAIPGRKRGASVAEIHFDEKGTSFLYDNVRTVVAFKAVIDYKLSDNSPVTVPDSLTQDWFTQYYTQSFIEQANNRLGDRSKMCRFVRDTTELKIVLSSEVINDEG